MNKNGVPSANCAADANQFYAALMPDRLDRETFLSGNNAHLLAQYQSMPNDQIDWAVIAQRWIKMRESWMQPDSAFIPSPPPPPSFDRDDDVQTASNASLVSNTSLETTVAYEEQGEAPMEVEKEDENFDDMPVPPMPPSIAGQICLDVDWNVSPAGTWSHMNNSSLAIHPPNQINVPDDHNLTKCAEERHRDMRSSTVDSPSLNAFATGSASSGIWQIENSHHYPPGMSKNSSQTSGTSVNSLASNKRNLVRHGHPDSAEQQSSSRLPGLMDREITMNELSSLELAVFTHKDVKCNLGVGSSSINEAKRKLLPAWIREGLEKMEREKLRQYERELEQEQKAKDVETRNKFFRLSTKKILTQILMETTGEALKSIATEISRNVQKRKAAKQAASLRFKKGLATCTGGLGLGIYGDSDDDDEDDEDDPADDSRNNKTKSAVNDSDIAAEGGSSEEDTSDSEVFRQLKEKIRIRQNDFIPIASEIEQWLENTNDYYPVVVSKNERKESTPDDESDGDSDEEKCDEKSGSLFDLRREHRGESSLHGDVDSGDGLGSGSAEELLSFTNPSYRGAYYASMSHDSVARRQRDKRISRFSDRCDTVRSTHMTHVSFLRASKTASTNKEGGLGTTAPVTGTPTNTLSNVAGTAKPLSIGLAQSAVQLGLRKTDPGLSRIRDTCQTIYKILPSPASATPKPTGAKTPSSKSSVDESRHLRSDSPEYSTGEGDGRKTNRRGISLEAEVVSKAKDGDASERLPPSPGGSRRHESHLSMMQYRKKMPATSLLQGR
ncbi:arginine/serine-rich protein PNISR [Anopheles nili]|uniref:arginine/serine-rich protein PNISR n=1 Tax=Anopheles nili TaxID=185578 RepID=UPI00237BAC89|nr:arginine/serine-rich protein PNISR [Anopheles nili]